MLLAICIGSGMLSVHFTIGKLYGNPIDDPCFYDPAAFLDVAGFLGYFLNIVCAIFSFLFGFFLCYYLVGVILYYFVPVRTNEWGEEI